MTAITFVRCEEINGAIGSDKKFKEYRGRHSHQACIAKFSEYFSTIVPQQNSALLPVLKVIHFLIAPALSLFERDEALKKLSQLDTDKATRRDRIPVKVLKMVAPSIIAGCLTPLFNTCL